MPITFRQIEAFRAVMTSGTVTQAAEILHVSQPAVSRMLADLEYRLGFKLFNRTGRQLIPTEEAHALQHEIQRAFIGLKEITEAAHAIREYRSGHLRLITIPSLASSFMPDLLSHFTTRYPDVSVTLEVQPSPRVAEWIVSLQCDLGISLLPLDNPLVQTTPLTRGNSVCVLPRGHRLARRPAIEPADLGGESFVSFRADSVYRFQIDGIFRAAGVDRRMNMEARTTEAVLSMVAAGLGVSIIGPFFPIHLITPELVVRPFHPAVVLEFAVLHPAHKPPTRLAQRFLQVLEERLPALEARSDAVPTRRRRG